MLRFRLFGIPFVVAPFFWVFSAILGSSGLEGSPHLLLLLAVWVACVFVSIVVHELGHAFAARHYGLQPAIALAGLGGLTSYPGGGLTRAQHIVVSLAGPTAGYALYLVVRVFSHRIGLLGLGTFFDNETPASLAAWEALRDLSFINFYWTLFNLIPVLPLDGGQILRDALGPRLLGPARIIGVVCAIAVCLYAVEVGQIYLAFLFGYLAYVNLRGNPGALPGGVGRADF